MGAADGGERDTEGTVALQGVCGKHPCTPFPLLMGDERFTGLCPPAPDSSPTKTSPSPHHHDATLNYFMQTLSALMGEKEMEEGARKGLRG